VNKALAMRLALGVYLYDVFKARTQGATIVEAAASGGESSRGKSGSPAPGSALEYISDYQPRVVGLLHTAPVYDGLTVPQSVPIIAGCVQSKKSGCNCYDQRGNHYGTTQEICAQFIDRGIFFAFKPDPLPTPTTSAKVAAVAAPAATTPALTAAPAALAAQAEPQSLAPPPIVPQSSPWRFNG